MKAHGGKPLWLTTRQGCHHLEPTGGDARWRGRVPVCAQRLAGVEVACTRSVRLDPERGLHSRERSCTLHDTSSGRHYGKGSFASWPASARPRFLVPIDGRRARFYPMYEAAVHGGGHESSNRCTDASIHAAEDQMLFLDAENNTPGVWAWRTCHERDDFFFETHRRGESRLPRIWMGITTSSDDPVDCTGPCPNADAVRDILTTRRAAQVTWFVEVDASAPMVSVDRAACDVMVQTSAALDMSEPHACREALKEQGLAP
ncbi:MAG: hypothetical protein AAGA56_08725 [Myxococcota bacterium]